MHFYFRLQRGGDITRRFIRDNRDPFFSRLIADNADGIARAGNQLGLDTISMYSVRHKKRTVRNCAELPIISQREHLPCWGPCRLFLQSQAKFDHLILWRTCP